MAPDASLAFTQRLRADLKTAMQARAREEAALLRSLIGAIDNAQSVPLAADHKPADTRAFGDGSGEVARRPLDEAAIRTILEREIAEREAAAGEMAGVGAADRAAALRAEAAVVARYLPG